MLAINEPVSDQIMRDVHDHAMVHKIPDMRAIAVGPASRPDFA